MVTLKESNSDSLWNSPGELVDYLVATYHTSLRRDVRDLDRYTEFLANQRLVPLPAMDHLRRELIRFADLLETHLAEQEVWLFPRIREDQGKLYVPVEDDDLTDNLDNRLDEVKEKSSELLRCLARVGSCLREPSWFGKGRLVRELVEKIHQLQRDLRTYARLGAESLIPRVRRLLREQCAATIRE